MEYEQNTAQNKWTKPQKVSRKIVSSLNNKSNKAKKKKKQYKLSVRGNKVLCIISGFLPEVWLHSVITSTLSKSL